MPQNKYLRFAHGLQVKTEILHTKVIRGKVVEEIELTHVHCFTTQDFEIKFIKIKDNLSQLLKTNFFQDHCDFGSNLRFLNAIGLFLGKSGISC